MPNSTDGAVTERALIADLVDANHILFHQGVVDAFGHVSVRLPSRQDHFLLARSMAPALVTAEDLIEFDLDGSPVKPNGQRIYLERFIHSEIYRARPDVMAVVHSHSPSVVPFTVVKNVPFRPVCHMCGFLGGGAHSFEIRDVAGAATDLLIRDGKLGRALAQSLGEANTVLMRGHGSTVVGPNLRQAVYRAVYTEVNARLLAEAMRLGPVEFLSDQEAKAAMVNEAEIERPWQLWKAAVPKAG